MPRGKRGFPIKQARNTPEAIENLAVHHVLAIRQTGRGEITAVKHVAYGWLSAKEYGQLILLKDLEPAILEIIKGGYQLKAWLWGSDVTLEIAGTGVAVPFGAFIFGTALTLYAIDTSLGNKKEAILDLLTLALPFGELWIMYRGIQLGLPALQNVWNFISGGITNIPITHGDVTITAPSTATRGDHVMLSASLAESSPTRNIIYTWVLPTGSVSKANDNTVEWSVGNPPGPQTIRCGIIDAGSHVAGQAEITVVVQ